MITTILTFLAGAIIGPAVIVAWQWIEDLNENDYR